VSPNYIIDKLKSTATPQKRPARGERLLCPKYYQLRQFLVANIGK
jgi:hypothetical protein